MPTWEVYVDWGNDGIDSADDITPYVHAAAWSLGAREPYQLAADESTLTMTLVNSDKRFSPEYASGPYYGQILPRRRCQVIADGTVMWTGWLETVTPEPSPQPYARLVAHGPKLYLDESEVYIPLQEGKRSDEIIETILNDVDLPTVTTGVWLLGVDGSSELGETTYVTNSSFGAELEEGSQTFAYAGDTWESGVTAYAAIKGVVEAERGRIFFNRSAQPVFWGRQHTQLNRTPSRTITAASFAEYVYGANWANIVRVRFAPRTVSAASNDVLYQLEKDLIVRPGQHIIVRAHYQSAPGVQIAGKDPQEPSTGASTLAYTGGTVTVTDFQADARSALIELTNSDTATAATVTTLTVLGKKIEIYRPTDVEVHDSASITLHWQRIHQIDASMLDDGDDAHQIAHYELARRKDPFGELRSLLLLPRDDETVGHMIGAEIGSVIAVDLSADNINHSGLYIVIGEEHATVDGMSKHQTRLYLERLNLNDVWLLGEAGFSELGETTVLGF